MHEWHSNEDRNIMALIEEFKGYEFNTDYGGTQTVSEVKVTNSVFSSDSEARSFVTRSSYGGNAAYIAAYTSKKLSKAYQNAFNNFLEKYKEYTQFQHTLTIGYGRKSTKVTCPNCGSSISLKFGNRFKVCPVCSSRKIISDSNWKALDTKRRMVEKAAENLSKEAEKNSVTFLCGIEWHC